ncbi:MAG: DUF2062 domain-containing protein [Alphaproteobacteria bacterium]|nr:DUF2062 domain-containing protein [Alphaproteobacteria bacterium]
MNGTPYSLAVGMACGVAISFTPFVGFHILLAAITAWILRGNVLASALGTIAGNPWTFPFIWVTVLYTGRLMLFGISGNESEVNFTIFFEKLYHAVMNLDFHLFFADIWPILWPMIVGCIPYYIVVWGITYFFVKRALDNLNVKYGTKLKGEI